MKRLSAVGLMILAALFVIGASVGSNLQSRAAGSFTSLSLASARPAAQHLPRGCTKLYSIGQTQHAARVIYRGTRNVHSTELRTLSRMVHCQRNPRAVGYVRWYVMHQQRLWWLRCHPPVSWSYDTASWFDDSGATACGTHYTYGFATLDGTPCGGVVYMRGPSGVVIAARREDSGPYVGGRRWDLNPGLRAALGCGDLCTVASHR